MKELAYLAGYLIGFAVVVFVIVLCIMRCSSYDRYQGWLKNVWDSAYLAVLGSGLLFLGALSIAAMQAFALWLSSLV